MAALDALPDFEFQPLLVGTTITLRPLVAADFDALHAAAADPLIWQQHPDPLRWQRELFRESYFNPAVADGKAFVVIDNASGVIVGSSRYYDWKPATREVAIGYTFLARSHWGGVANPQMKRLMLEHAFRWAKVVWFHIGANNQRSRTAMERLGGRYSHDESFTVRGVPSSHACYRIDAAR